MDPITLTAIATIIALLVTAAIDPAGFINNMICGLIDIIAIPFPATPNALKLSSLITSISVSLPVFGRALIESIIGTIRDLFVLYSMIKIYKLIPFKAT